MHIYLIGFMGSGKTTVGKKLALKMGIPFVDLDQHIEKSHGMSVTELFEKSGESYFRNIESESLKDISSGISSVISLGGGTPCYKNNLSILQETGKIIYLNLNAGMLFSRLKSSKASRPLIKSLDDEALKTYISHELKRREPFYNQADIIIGASDLNSTRLEELAVQCTIEE